MIRAKVQKDREGNCLRISIKGPALFDDKGKDIVCAAVSILTINTVNSLEAFTNSRFTTNTDDGIEVIFTETPDEKAKLLLDSYLLGLKGISEEYSQNVRLSIEEV